MLNILKNIYPNMAAEKKEALTVYIPLQKGSILNVHRALYTRETSKTYMKHSTQGKLLERM